MFGWKRRWIDAATLTILALIILTLVRIGLKTGPKDLRMQPMLCVRWMKGKGVREEVDYREKCSKSRKIFQENDRSEGWSRDLSCLILRCGASPYQTKVLLGGGADAPPPLISSNFVLMLV